VFEREFLPVIFIVCLAGIGLVHYYIKNEYLRGSLSAILDALFIASFLAYAVDPVLKQGLLKEGVRSIFRYIYGYTLPHALQDFFDTTIVGTKEIRTEGQLHWRIIPHPSAPDSVLVPLHASFGVLNFVNERRQYKHEVFAISDTPGTKGSIEAMYCKDLETGHYIYKLTKDELLDVQVGHEKKRDYKSGPAVNLEPKASDEKSRYSFGVHYGAESTWPNGLDWFRFSEVTTEAEVIITVDERLKDHFFSVIPSPPNGKDGMVPAFDPQSQEYRCQWHYPRLFVPNEIMIVRWQPAEAPVPAGHSAPAAFAPPPAPPAPAPPTPAPAPPASSAPIPAASVPPATPAAIPAGTPAAAAQDPKAT
jgi:hypothetical protein